MERLKWSIKKTFYLKKTIKHWKNGFQRDELSSLERKNGNS